MKIENAMVTLAKISSVLILFSTALSFGLMRGIFGFSQPKLIISIFLPTLLLIPVFYFAWFQKHKIEYMKNWAQITSIIIPIYLIYGTLTQIIEWWESGYYIAYIISYIQGIIILVPLYYFAWKKK
ncbi:MAG: hypothetical protein KJ939_00845 [Nanoarchaeota archaeon]|nr:hypothetical protein [Nanoarchaeota archaeon]MCG2719605.1 hypothetical protein [Nanoarchaeota archaeon]